MPPHATLPIDSNSSLWGKFRDGLATLPLIHQATHTDHQLVDILQHTSMEDFWETPIQNRTHAIIVQAGLQMIAGEWDQAHNLVQNLETTEAWYWHGILHRREPDTSNARYWFRRLPTHPVFEALSLKLREKGSFSSVMSKSGRWEPMQFIEACSIAQDNPTSTDIPTLQWWQEQEIWLLLEHGRSLAVGKT